MKLGICVDSVTCLSQEKIDKYDMGRVHLHLNTSDKSYTEFIDIDTELFVKLKNEGVRLKSSQPSPEAFKVEYEAMRDRGYTDIISIHPTNVMTGTVNSARIGASMVEGVNIHIFEGNAAAFEQEMNVDYAIKLIEDGLSPEDILVALNEMRDYTENYFLIEDLMVLADSGRIPRVAARVGSLIKLKTMIRLHHENGFSLIHKYRTVKKVVNQYVDDIKAYIEANGRTNVYITQVDRMDFVNDIIEGLKGSDANVVVCGPIGPVLKVNFGTHGMGVCWAKAF